MISGDLWSGFNRPTGLLVDSNLLVLFTVGKVNRARISNFKRTRKYISDDYDLLLRVMGKCGPLYTVAHVMAEVSNLTDLPGDEQREARRVLKETIAILKEPVIHSDRAAGQRHYEALGLTDAAITEMAHEHKCTVLTDDFDLYRLSRWRAYQSLISIT